MEAVSRWWNPLQPFRKYRWFSRVEDFSSSMEHKRWYWNHSISKRTVLGTQLHPLSCTLQEQRKNHPFGMLRPRDSSIPQEFVWFPTTQHWMRVILMQKAIKYVTSASGPCCCPSSTVRRCLFRFGPRSLAGWRALAIGFLRISAFSCRSSEGMQDKKCFLVIQ